MSDLRAAAQEAQKQGSGMGKGNRSDCWKTIPQVALAAQAQEEIDFDTEQTCLGEYVCAKLSRKTLKNPLACNEHVLQTVESLIARQFETTHDHLVAHQRKTLNLLKEFCIKIVCNPASAQHIVDNQATFVGNGVLIEHLGKASQAWSDHPANGTGPSNGALHKQLEESNEAWPDHTPAMLGAALAQNPIRISDISQKQRPGTPTGLAPEMPGTVEAVTSSVTETQFEAKRKTKIKRQHTSEEELAARVFSGHLREKRSMIQKTAKRNSDLVKKAKAVDDPTKEGKGPKAVFADAAAMKEKVKEAVMKPTYNVVQFYKTDGWAQRIARSFIFENLTLSVIGLNALWIWIDTDYNKAPTLLDADPFFQIVENLFCIYFFAELVIRFVAFAEKRNCLKDMWFVFDTSLVMMMVCETWLLNVAVWAFGLESGGGLGNASILRLVRLLRLTRMARLARLLRAMPELMVLVKGISVAARSVIFTLLLLVVILYIFAIAFRQITEGSDLESSHFQTVPSAMGTLLLKGVLPDQADLVTDLGDVSYAYGACVLLFLLLASLTIMNMLVGVLCEVVSVVSAVEKEQMMVNFVKTKLLSLISGIDSDDNQRISREEFEQLLLLPEGARIIQEVGVDVVGLVDFVPVIFGAGAELTFIDVMELVLQLRGTNTATVRDIVDLRKFLTQMSAEAHDQIVEKVEEAIDGTVNQIYKQIEMKMGRHSAATVVATRTSFGAESRTSITSDSWTIDHVSSIDGSMA